MSDTVSIRALARDDWEIFRAMRLKALKNHPGVFGAKHDEEEKLSPVDWQDWLCNKKGCVFGLFGGGELIGITGIAADRNDPSGTTAVLYASFIDTKYRGQHFSDMLYRARLGWLLTQPQLEKVVVSHRRSNEASRRANQKFGFRQTRIEPKIWPDGTSEDQVFYELTKDEVAEILSYVPPEAHRAD